MKFEESEFLDLTDTPLVFIYFLIHDDEVVYVGQTMRGLSRVYSHIHNKHFTKIYIIECDEDELDYLEDYYIFKYRPIYNKRPNYKCNFSIHRLIKEINNIYGSRLTKPKIKKMIKELELVPREFDGELYFSIEDFYQIIGCIDDYKKGAPLSEVFNIGI